MSQFRVRWADQVNAIRAAMRVPTRIVPQPDPVKARKNSLPSPDPKAEERRSREIGRASCRERV